jgi:hypothetical protein
MSVAAEPDLPTLRISVGTLAETRSQAIFRAFRSGQEPREIARCPLPELGLPVVAGDLPRTPEEAFRVPENAFRAIKAAADALGPSPLPPQEALWLELYSPRGYLYLLPWERLLSPLGRPLLRRSRHDLRPAASHSTLYVGLCASSPAVLQRLCRIWLERTARQVSIDIFTDGGVVAAMREWAAGDARVVVHDPPPESLWLPWMRDAMVDKALDVMHFAGEGYLDRDRGAIALPDGTFGGAPEMTGFLSETGAWCLFLSGPIPNARPAGLRELADAVELARPCVTAVHEMGRDDAELRQLGDAVATILGRVPPGLGPMPAVSCWVHPRFAQALALNEDTPAWVASATRTVEALQAKWLPREPGAAMDPDAAAALESIASLVREHVSERDSR